MTTKAAPPSGDRSTPISPPALLMMLSQTARPSPVPSPAGLVEKNGSKMRCCTSGVIAPALSRTLITTQPGSLKSPKAFEVREKHPTRLVESAVFGMLPKSKLGRKLRKKLKVYTGENHPHKAQKPQPLPAA